MSYKLFGLSFLFALLVQLPQAVAQFTISDEEEVVSIVYDLESSDLDSIVAHLLAGDIEAVSGNRPEVYPSLEGVKGNVIVIGDISSGLISTYMSIHELNGQWETYQRVFRSNIADGIDQAMFIVGSDPRGVAYGVFELSEEIGVSPWYWWADVAPRVQKSLSVSDTDSYSKPPSVKFRGIFLNDEGWGLEPWASKTFEPEVGNIGPKTYGRIFELLLRLKANMFWPAMHPNTVPFFQVPGNREAAEQWEIVVGSSHAEPMLRNNVGEWDHDTMGDFNYQTNDSSVYAYWEQRVKESKGLDAIYTVGMRGIHDSGMEGANSMEEKVSALEKVISDQRGLLGDHINGEVSEVPQSFTPYKEVLEIYESGMEVPEDITITWPDDNYGHIRRFSNKAEQGRSGGGGVYYHLSYLGSPHPYLLFSSSSPAKTWREMKRAWMHGMDQLWVANVGDLKRREWEMEFFLDIAWDIDSREPETIEDFYQDVASRDISGEYADQITELMWESKRLAAERKPELMGFNRPQWAGWPPIQDPEFSLFHYGDEVEKRLQSYQKLRDRADAISKQIPPEAQDAFFELVYFQIAGATALNEKILYAYKSREYAKQGRAVANQYSDSAFAAHQRLQELTQRYNKEVAGGKWDHSADPTPGYEKGSSVFFEPITTRIQTEGVRGIGLAIEGQEHPLNPVKGSLPEITTAGSGIKLGVSEAEVYGEMERAEDENGVFATWPDDGIGKTIPGPGNYDVIPYEVDSDTKAVFTFENKMPGGVHTLYLKVDHPDEDQTSWWVTLNDHAPVLAEGNASVLKVEEVVLQAGTNTLTIHPHEPGANLYGVELVQEAVQITPETSGSAQLPAFSSLTEDKYFIDVFSRGEEEVTWSAKVSAPWIGLSEENGTLKEGSTRVRVHVDHDRLPEGEQSEGKIEISSGEFLYVVNVVVMNPEQEAQPGAFVESNGVIAIPAHDYHEMKGGTEASWKSVKGLGRSGSAMVMDPLDSPYIMFLNNVKNEAPVLSYELVVTEGGQAKLIIEAVPAFASDITQILRLAISVDDGEPQWITFDMYSYWTTKVAENRMTGTARLDLEPGTHTLHLWGTDPSVNPDRILIDFGGLQPSYNGPESTRIKTFPSRGGD